MFNAGKGRNTGRGIINDRLRNLQLVDKHEETMLERVQLSKGNLAERRRGTRLVFWDTGVTQGVDVITQAGNLSET